MPLHRLSETPIASLIALGFTLPLVSLLLAVIIASGLALYRRTRAGDQAIETRWRPGERRAIGGAALLVLLAFTAENVLRGYVLDMVDRVEWWQFATPMIAATVGLVVIVVALGPTRTPPPRGPGSPTPTMTTTRRSWTTFGPRRGLIAAGLVAAALVATTIACGLASSPDSNGRYIYIDVPVPNTAVDPVRPWSYGWAYGVPVLVAAALLALTTWIVLHRNALRPFRSVETARRERVERRSVARGAVTVTASSMLLALAGAWRFVQQASPTSLSVGNGIGADRSYEASPPFGDLMHLIGWSAPVLEVVAFTLLLLLTAAALPRRRREHPDSDRPADETPAAHAPATGGRS